MPTTFIGRDNNNKPCYHVRKTDGLSVAAMKGGVQDDTLFHSSLPYLQVLHTETSGKSSTLNWTYSGGGVTHYYDIFNLSSSVKNYLASGYACLATVIWSDGSESIIDINPYNSAYKSINPGSGGIPTFYNAFASVVANSPTFGSIGWWALNYIPTSANPGGSTGILNGDQFASLSQSTGGASISFTNNSPTYLNPSSQCLVFHRGNGSYIGSTLVETATSPTPSSIRLTILNITINTSWSFLGLGITSGDIKISKAGLVIGGTNIFSGAKFLTLDSYNKVSGNSVTAGSFTGNLKVSSPTYPAFSYRGKIALPFSDTATPNISGVTPVVLAAGAGAISQKPYYRVVNRAPNTLSSAGYSSIVNAITSTFSSYSVDTFKILSIPTSNSCTMSADNLVVNNTSIFTGVAPILYPTKGITGTINIGTYTFSSSSAQSTMEVLATFSVPTNTRLSLVFNCNKFLITNQTSYDSITGGTVTYNMQSRYYTDNLGIKLCSLSEGQYCHILTFVDNVAHNDSNLGVGISIVYMFKRVGSTVQLIRQVLKTVSNGTQSLTIPGFRVNYMQLASAF